MTIKFKTAYGERVAKITPVAQYPHEFDKEGKVLSKTQQQFRDECDVNNIIKRMTQADLIEGARNSLASYGDFSQFADFQDSLNTVIAAQEMFNSLPAQVREAFNNSPAQFIAEASHPDYQDKLIKLGLADCAQVSSIPVDGDGTASAPQNAGEAVQSPSLKG